MFDTLAGTGEGLCFLGLQLSCGVDDESETELGQFWLGLGERVAERKPLVSTDVTRQMKSGWAQLVRERLSKLMVPPNQTSWPYEQRRQPSWNKQKVERNKKTPNLEINTNLDRHIEKRAGGDPARGPFYLEGNGML